jgi:hypothetical protein
MEINKLVLSKIQLEEIDYVQHGGLRVYLEVVEVFCIQPRYFCTPSHLEVELCKRKGNVAILQQ